MTHQRVLGKDDNIKLLEEIVFGGETFDETSDDEAPDETPIAKEKNVDSTVETAEESGKRPAWIDADDAAGNMDLPAKKRLAVLHKTTDVDKKVAKADYTSRLRKHFEKCSAPLPDWANPVKLNQKKKFDFDEGSDTEDLEGSGRIGSRFVATSSVNLPSGAIDAKLIGNVTQGDRKRGQGLKAVEFHKSSQVLLTAGENQRITLYQINGKTNPKLQEMAIDRFTIDAAHFSASGERVYAGSRLHSYLFYYDMIAGKVVRIPGIKSIQEKRMDRFVVSPDGRMLAFAGSFGFIHLLSAKTFECIDSIKMNGNVASLCYSADSSKLYSHGDDGEVYVWSMQSRSCLHRFFDDGCIKGTSVNISADNQFFACGSNTGIVNLYDVNTALKDKNPKPINVIGNLTTPISQVLFNSNSEILGFSSDQKDKAMRLLHTTSSTVFTNFPGRSTSLQTPKVFDFSLNSGYLAVGNNMGQVQLFRLLHYPTY